MGQHEEDKTDKVEAVSVACLAGHDDSFFWHTRAESGAMFYTEDIIHTRSSYFSARTAVCV